MNSAKNRSASICIAVRTHEGNFRVIIRYKGGLLLCAGEKYNWLDILVRSLCTQYRHAGHEDFSLIIFLLNTDIASPAYRHQLQQIALKMSLDQCHTSVLESPISRTNKNKLYGYDITDNAMKHILQHEVSLCQANNIFRK